MTAREEKLAAAELLSAAAVRDRCGLILEAAERGETPHFKLNQGELDAAAQFVVDVIRERYPRGDVPPHSRLRHFEVGLNRVPTVAPEADDKERARALIELVIVSVLLDAGAGPSWFYTEGDRRYTRSEGLGVASFNAVRAGLFSADGTNPWRVDASALQSLSESSLAYAFRHEPGVNELVGLDTRVELLRRLGAVVASKRLYFGQEGRLGNLYDRLSRHGFISAPEVLTVILWALGPIWPNRLELDGTSLGDCGLHSLIPDRYVPFHKLSQWMTYSLVEALQLSGVTVTDLNGLTGLAEYRNGGLFIDMGVIVPRDPCLMQQKLDPNGEAVVEWRALTVALIDRIAPIVRDKLGVSEADYPLAKILEGGTWAAGRKLAAKLRNGNPPLEIKSDGTLF